MLDEEHQPETRVNRFALEMYDHIKSIPLPRGFDEDGERLKSDKDEDVNRYVNMIPLLLEAISDEPSGVVPEIAMSMMNKPFAYLDLTKNSPELRRLAHTFYHLAFPVSPVNQKTDDVLLSTSTLYYLFMCEHTHAMVPPVPSIKSHNSQLADSLQYVGALLERTQALAHEKGLALLDRLVKPVDMMDREFNGSIKRFKINDHLFQIMVFSDSRSCRRQAYELFECLSNLVPLEDRVETFKSALTNNDVRSNVKAACVDLYRKSLTQIERKLCDNIDLLKEYNKIGGHKLVEFLKVSVDICLPGSKPDDILDNCDLITANLVLLKYLKLRDSNQSHHRIEEEEYLSSDQLRRGFFETLNNLLSTAMGDVRKLLSTKVDVDERQMLEWTMTRFELIKFTLVNTSSLYDC